VASIADLAVKSSHLGAMLTYIGYIDLSKRRVSAEEVVRCEGTFEKGKAVDSILTQVAKKRNVPPESLYEKIAWPLHKQYGHSYEAFKLSISCVASSNNTSRLLTLAANPKLSSPPYPLTPTPSLSSELPSLGDSPPNPSKSEPTLRSNVSPTPVSKPSEKRSKQARR